MFQSGNTSIQEGKLEYMNEFDNNYEGKNETVNTPQNNDTANNTVNNNTGYTQSAGSDFSNMSTREYMNNIANQARNDYNNGQYGYYSQNVNTEGQQYNNGYTNVNAEGQQYNNGYYNGAYVNNASYYEETPKKKKAKTKRVKTKNTTGKGKAGKFIKRGIAVVGVAAVFGLVSGGIFNFMTGGTIFTKDWKNKDQGTTSELETTEEVVDVVIPTTSVSSDGVLDSQSLDVSDIVEGVMPSVVSITIEGVEQYQTFFGQIYEEPVEGAGSGIIIGKNDSELLVATNNHVVSDATTVSVQFIDGEVYEAQVKGTDSDNDLAIIVVKLKDISSDTLAEIKIAQLGDSDALKVGEQVVAIGNALGYGQSVTTGIVSAKDRLVDTNTTPLIQTDAAINPGNSGGALLNMKGEVVGINSSKYMSTEVEGMGYAIPITKVQDILDNLMNRLTREKVAEENKGYLGISCSTISSEASEMYGLPSGVLIQEVSEGSAAEKAGLKKNYIITKFDGLSVSSSEDLINKLSYYEAGEAVEITYEVLKDDEYVEKTTTVILGKKDSTN